MSQPPTFHCYDITKGKDWQLVGITPHALDTIPPPKTNLLLLPRRTSTLSASVRSRAECASHRGVFGVSEISNNYRSSKDVLPH